MENLQIGTFGWQYDSWRGGFYPDDLPEEWMLDYYSNAYRVVLVPQVNWLSWGDEQIEEVVDAVEGDFSFYFEVRDACDETKESQLTAIVEKFSSLSAGVVMFSEEQGTPLTCAGLPVTLVSKTQILPGWQWAYGDQTCSGALCGVVEGVSDDAKAQTELLQSYMKSLPEALQGGALLVKAENVNMKQLFNLKTIGEFLGY